MLENTDESNVLKRRSSVASETSWSMVRISATAKAESSVLSSLRTAAAIVSAFIFVRTTTEAAGKVDCQNGMYACNRGFSSRLSLRTSSTTPTMVHQVG